MVIALTWITALLLVPLSVATIRSYLESKHQNRWNVKKITKALSPESILLREIKKICNSSLDFYHHKAERLTTLEIIALTFVCSLALILNLFSVTGVFPVGPILYMIIGINIAALPFHFHKQYAKEHISKKTRT
jgi:hypothetical protein